MAWQSKNRVALTVLSTLCFFSLFYTCYWIKYTSRIWKPPPLKKGVSPPPKSPDLQPSSSTVQPEYPSTIRCPILKQDPFAPRMMALIDMKVFRSNHSCNDTKALGIFKGAAFHVEKGNLLIRDVQFPDDVECCLKVVTRDLDESVKIHQNCTELGNEVNQTTAIEPPTEVVMVTCNNSKGQTYYKDAFQIFQEKPEVDKRIKTWQEEQLKSEIKVNDDARLSVIVYGLDRVSQMHFERSMPLTKWYLENDLKAVKLKGYNKVAENTFPNVMALLAGLTREEATRSCVKPSKRFNNCSFIWNTFRSHGYRTAFFDEEVEYSLFNMNHYNAFADHPGGPTDYYGRPFALLMERKMGFNGVCHGPRLSFQHILDNVMIMADMFNSTKRPYFNFIWASWLSHVSYSTLPWGDKPLLEALKYLHGNGHLNHTAFFLLADHGPRSGGLLEDFGEIMIENRMPIAYIVLPPWFSQRYPKAFENLQWNGEFSVTSPHDMYKTLQDMLDLDRFEGNDGNWRANRYFQQEHPEIAKRGQSLFELNLQGRNCESAAIPPLWCLCHQKAIPLEKDSFLAKSAAQGMIDEVNRKMENFSKCEKLEVGEILNATVILLSEETWAKPDCQLVINNGTSEAVNSSSCNDTIYIFVRVSGSPHDPVFQTMMIRNSTGMFPSVTPSEVIREDYYETKGKCVDNKQRPHCICKSFQ